MASRLADCGDAQVIAALLTAFNIEFETPVPPGDVLERRLIRLLSRPDVFVLIALDPDPVGFGFVATRPSPYYEGPTANLDELYVAPARRRRGLGAEMISLLLKEARDRGIGEIQIPVDAGDVDARRFYESHGFTNLDDGEHVLCYLREL